MKKVDNMKILIMLIVMILTSVSSINAQSDGIPDPDFVNGGLRVFAIKAETYSGIVLDDGSFITIGDEHISSSEQHFLMMKFKANGVADSSFGTHGVVSMRVNGESKTTGYELIEHENGQLTAVGSIQNYHMFLLRFNSDGTLDDTFGIGGTAILDYGFAPVFVPNGIAELDDGKFLITGSRYNGASYQFFIARVNADGTPDETFASSLTAPGVILLNLGTQNEVGESIHLNDDGSFYVSGMAQTLSNYEGIVVKCSADGSIDESFGENGVAYSDLHRSTGDGEHHFGIAVSSDGYIYMPGTAQQPGASRSDVAMVRFTPQGELDASFGTDGMVQYDFDEESDFGRCVAVQENGKVILAGKVFDNIGLRFGMVRFNTDGTLDETFGVGGEVTDFTGVNPHSIFLTKQNKILLMGQNTEYVFAASSFLNPGGATSITPVNNALVSDYRLEQNYPNPFNPATTIRFAIPEAGNVTLKVYNTLGEETATLVNNQLSAGTYSVNFDASHLASGVYIYTLKSAQKILSNKMLLIK